MRPRDGILPGMSGAAGSGGIGVAVIVASTREGRIGGTVADWFIGRAGRRPGLRIDTIDLDRTPLPGRLPARRPRGDDRAPELVSFAERVARADGFVVVTPEYNHGYPGPLKNALDLVREEWRAKPMGFVSYGGPAGGVRAVEQLRLVAVELHLVPLRDAVAIPMARAAFGDGGVPDDPGGRIADDVETMLDRLEWWSRALAVARRAAPY